MSATKRIVVAGATGLIGSKLVAALAERGDHVIALVRDIERGRRAAPGATEYVLWSSSDTEGKWKRTIDGADAVANFAGTVVATRWTEARKRGMRESRIGSTAMIVDAIENAAVRPEVFISSSAVGIYGASVPQPVDESAPGGEDFLARLVVDWEKEAMKAEQLGVRVVCIRTGIVLDPDQGALSKLLPPFRFFVGGPIASGRQPFPWIHVDDEIRSILWAIDNRSITGAVNLGAPGIVDNREFSRVLGEVLGRPSWLPVPGFVLGLIFGEGSIILTEGQQMIPRKLLDSGFEFRYPALREALTDLLC
jgi:uncharacterized protein (TIGR01777 family)